MQLQKRTDRPVRSASSQSCTELHCSGKRLYSRFSRVFLNGAYRSRTGDLLLAKKNINTDFASLAVEKRLFPADTEGDYTLPVTRVAWWPPMERQMATNLPPP